MMKIKTTLIGLVEQILSVYACISIVLLAMAQFQGENLKMVSDIFSLGSRGISLSVMLQFLVLSILIVLICQLILSDVWIKKLSMIIRCLLCILLISSVCVFFANQFSWFVKGQVLAWVLFALCFLLSFFISIGIMFLQNAIENKKMDACLKLYKEKNEGKQEG